jgi:hypothetical protein
VWASSTGAGRPDPERLAQARQAAGAAREAGLQGRGGGLRLDGVEVEQAVVVTHQDAHPGGGAERQRLGEVEVAGDPAAGSEGVAPVDGEERHLHAELPEPGGLSGVGDAVPGVVDDPAAEPEHVAEEDAVPLGVERHLLVRGGDGLDHHLAEDQPLPGVEGPERRRGDADGEGTGALRQRDHHQGAGAGRQEPGERLRIHVVGVAMGAEDQLDPAQPGRGDGRRHHAAVRQLGAGVLPGQMIGEVGIDDHPGGAVLQHEPGLAQPVEAQRAVVRGGARQHRGQRTGQRLDGDGEVRHGRRFPAPRGGCPPPRRWPGPRSRR